MGNATKVHWHEHTQSELQSILPRIEVVLVPTGSTEIHGPHPMERTAQGHQPEVAEGRIEVVGAALDRHHGGGRQPLLPGARRIRAYSLCRQ